ncbi:MAG: hypothetical protein ACTSVV_02215 [Promethearchaeota archaeon]
MSDENNEIDGLLDSLLDDIKKVDEKDKKVDDSLNVPKDKTSRSKPIVIKPKTIKMSPTKIKILPQKEPPQTLREKPIQELVLKQKSGVIKPKLKNIERLKLESEAKRLGIPFDELLRRKGLSDEIKIIPKPKLIQQPSKEDRLKIKKIESKSDVKNVEKKKIPKPINGESKVYRASIPLSTKDSNIFDSERRKRIEKIKFTAKTEEDTIGYKSPLGFRKRSSSGVGYVSVIETREKEEKKIVKIEESQKSEEKEEEKYVPNVGGIPLFVDDAKDQEVDDDLLVDDAGYLSPAYGLKCPKCGKRFEQQDPERAECPHCGYVFWI